MVNWVQFEQDVEVSFASQMHDLRQVHAQHGGLVEVVLGQDAELRLADQLLGLVDVCALETDDDGQCEVQLFGGGDDTLCNDIATHDSTEDVHKDHVDLRIGGDDLKSFLDRVGSGAATDVQEVCWIPSVELDDVHRGHCKTGTVDHAADGSIESDVVQVKLRGSNFLRIFLREIASREQILLTELCVVIEAHFSIEGEVCGEEIQEVLATRCGRIL